MSKLEMAFPEDIQQTATRFAGKYLAHDISCERLYRDVAKLLLAERERCARIADEHTNASCDAESPTAAARLSAQGIAGHIRQSS